MSKLEGTFTVTITPFTADGRKIEVSVLKDFVDWQIEEGAHGLIPVASTGEFLSLSDDERRQVAATVIQQTNKRVPVVVGAGAECTWDAVRYSREAEELGADGVIVIPPYYSTPTDEELYRHYKTIGEAVSIPVMLYNNPATANIDMLPPLIARLSEIDNVSYIKESTMDVTRVRDIIRLSDERLAVFGGVMGYESFLNGAVGWTAVGCNLMPGAFSDMYRHCVEKVDLDAARVLYRRILPVIDLVGQHRYVSATKQALELMGLPVGPPRPPRLRSSGDELACVERTVRDLELTFR
jgi:4-hydroxy-tetrahydrodipicolinate synthase